MKVSLLLASAALSAASFLVIPDDQTIANLAFSKQAPLSSNDNAPKPAIVEGPHNHGSLEDSPKGEPHHPEHGRKEHHLQPAEYVLTKSSRRHNRRLRNWFETSVFLETVEGVNDIIFHETPRELDPEQFLDLYHHPGHGHHHHHDDHSKPFDGDWPPKPPSWPPKPPPKPPGDKPHWPPKPPGDRPGKRPHHPWKPHPPTKTIWELISTSNHTTKFAKHVAEHEDLVAILNGTIANYTLFVPTDHAFDKFKKAPKDWKPPKEFIKKLLTYHISNDFYPAFKLLLGHTIPSALDAPDLGGSQRLRVGLTPGGLTVNFYAHVVAANIFATNGVVHALDSLLFPPPEIAKIISFFPSEFSTFLLAAQVTNLTDSIPHEDHTGSTLFAPPNSAFQKLGPKINAFLFSPWGRKYLKALLKYHIVWNETLYSDAYYHPTAGNKEDIPKGHYHVDLPTLLEGKHLSIDISRFGGLINIIINAVSAVKIEDVVARDGVIQVVGNVLIPPRKPPRGDETEMKEAVEGMELKEFVERFDGIVEGNEAEMKEFEESYEKGY